MSFSEPSVAIFGGGIAGLTAAHELAERRFRVTVYEKAADLGGEARSMLSPEGFPGEHAVHNVAHLYYQLKDTLRRIPTEKGTLLDNVTAPPAGSRAFFYFQDREPITILRHLPLTLEALRAFRKYQKSFSEVIPRRDLMIFVRALFKILCMSDERRIARLENESWKSFFDRMGLQSANAYKYLFRLPEFFIASAESGMANAESMSLLTAKILLAALIYPIASQHSSSDFFNGPSSDVFIRPWVEHLRNALSVEIRPCAEVTAIRTQAGRVTGVSIREGMRESLVQSDNYVFALPFEVLASLGERNDVNAVIPAIAKLANLQTTGAAGIQFFDANESEAVFPGGWMLFMDSPWAIAGVYQSRRLWPQTEFKPPIHGILSLVWSSFNNPGILYGRPSSECTALEIEEEILAQMRAHRGADSILGKMKIHSSFIDPDMRFKADGGRFIETKAKLFMRTPGCRGNQPEAATNLENVFLAGDYLRTISDSPSMESANESGRRAANAILERYRHKSPRCFLIPRSGGITPLKMLDEMIYRKRQ